MPEKNNWFKRNVSKRNLIKKDESKISYMQIIGFILILGGILYMTIYRLISTATDEGMAISFFIIMLGMAFAFPSLLKAGNKEMSTMRIVVFMMVNVICLLLIKIGWGAGIDSLEDIGLNEYWMGVIAFIFGAKATQAYFESKLAARREQPKEGMGAIELTNAEIAKLAVEQNQQYLKVKFPNILSVSDAVDDLNAKDSHVIALYLKDNNTAGIPHKLQVQMPDRSTRTISTEIITGLRNRSVQLHHGEKINTANQNGFGSVCCLVTSLDDSNFKGVVTAGHVYSGGNATNMKGALSAVDQKRVSVNDNIVGKWIFQVIVNGLDMAIAALEGTDEDASNLSFKDNGFYVVQDSDVKTCNVTLVSTVSGTRQGFVLDYNLGFEVPYDDIDKFMSRIILIGSTTDRNNSKTLSARGDSGGCVYNTKTNQLLGLILGGDEKFTYVLPLKDTLERRNYELV